MDLSERFSLTVRDLAASMEFYRKLDFRVPAEDRDAHGPQGDRANRP